MIQGIILFIILGMGICLFKLYGIKTSVKQLVLSASFVMVTLICKRFFTILIPLFGVESFKIGIEYIPLMIAGFMLSPTYAFMIGLCCDLIGLIIVPTGFPFFGFTLTMILVCVIPSLVKHHLSKIPPKMIVIASFIMLAALGFGGCSYLFGLEALTISDTVIQLTPMIKTVLMMIIACIVVSVICCIYILSKQASKENMATFALWTLSVILVECLCTLFLTPLWLSMMYGIPFTVSLCIRVVKEVFVIPLEIFVGFILVKAIYPIINKP